MTATKAVTGRRRPPQRTPIVPSCTVEIIPTGKRITLMLPLPTPSLNEFYHAHWRKQHRAKEQWLLMLRAVVGRSLLGAKALGRRRLTVERRGVRALDMDNLYGGLKSVLIDNLRKLELLHDDDAKSMDLVATNVAPANGFAAHTVVVLEDVD